MLLARAARLIAQQRHSSHYAAAVCDELGAPLRVQQLPRPALAAGEVRVAVRAAGVNFADVLAVQGRYQVRHELPFVPGFEAAGTIAEVGPPPLEQGEQEPPQFVVGDPVLALPTHGAFASELVLPASRCIAVP